MLCAVIYYKYNSILYEDHIKYTSSRTFIHWFIRP